jgi:hypothetical protein
MGVQAYSPGEGPIPVSSVLTCRAMYSVAGPGGPVNWVLSISGFHRFLATKLVSSETNKAERGQIVDITLYDLWKCGTAAPGRLILVGSMMGIGTVYETNS